MMIIQAGTWNFAQLFHILVWQLAISLNAFPSMSFRIVGPRNGFCVRFSYPDNLADAPAEIRDSNISLSCSTIASFGLHSRWVHPKYTWSKYDTDPSRKYISHQFLTHGSHIQFLSAILMSSTHTDQNKPCFRWTNRHSKFGTFSYSSSGRTPSNCLLHNNRAGGCPYKFRSTNVRPSFWLSVSWNTYPYIRTCWLRKSD